MPWAPGCKHNSWCPGKFPPFFLSLLFVPRRRNPIFCFTLKEVRFSCARQSFMFPQSATKNYDIKIMMMKKINIVSYVPLAPPIFFYICFILFGNIPSLRPERIQVPAPANVFHNLYILKPSSSKVWQHFSWISLNYDSWTFHALIFVSLLCAIDMYWTLVFLQATTPKYSTYFEKWNLIPTTVSSMISL